LLKAGERSPLEGKIEMNSGLARNVIASVPIQNTGREYSAKSPKVDNLSTIEPVCVELYMPRGTAIE
jgi:hypothetical protein